MKRLLITGVPGWLGDNLIASFYQDSRHDFSTLRCFVAPWISDQVIKDLQSLYPKLEVIKGDLQDREATSRAVKDCHSVLHGAGVIHVRRPSEWNKVNFEGTLNLINSSKLTETVKRFVFISSNAAGGRSEDGSPLREENHTLPLSHYGRSKKRAEEAVLNNSGQMDVVILRPCMFYGTPVPQRHVDFFNRVKHGWIPLIGAKLPRSMIHINNLTEACWLALESPTAIGKVFYIADDRIYSIEEYINSVASALRVKPKLVRLPSALASVANIIDNQLDRRGFYHQNLHLLGESNWQVGLSIDSAKKYLGYKPRLYLEDGVKEAIKWCSDRGLLR